MGTIKENPNDIQIKQAKSTRPDDLKNDQRKEYNDINRKKEKKANGDPDEGAVNDEPFDSESNNIHSKR